MAAAPSPSMPLMVALDERQAPAARAVARALSSEPRWRILSALGEQLRNVGELAQALEMPASTVTMHLAVLEEAGLVRSDLVPGRRGRQRVCQRIVDAVRLDLPRGEARIEPEILELTLPVGAYSDAIVAPTCGLAGVNALIGLLDEPASFYEAERFEAHLVWFRQGRLTYRFPNRLPKGALVDTLWLSAEVASEAPMHHHDWPSDITVWIDDVAIGTWTSPADYGGQRGLLSPSWWDARNSQYGILKEWRVSGEGSFIDGLRLSHVTLSDLDLGARPYIAVGIGVEAGARNVGGINLFGRGFGNYPQDLVLRIRYRLPRAAA
jgi:predicted transcriptional regulator